MARAAGPERRTMPMPPRPGGVEIATMVSSKSTGRFVTDFLMVLWIIFLGLVEWRFAGVFEKVVCRTWFFDGENVMDAW